MPTFAGGAFSLVFEGEIARVTLHRPERRNALNQAMWQALGQMAAAIDAEPGVKVAIVRGEGGHFAAGADIAEFEQVFATRQSTGLYAAAVHDGLLAFARMAKPSLAMIEGSCIGGGVALALACDIRLAAPGAKFGVTPAKLGIVYNMFDTRMLVDAVGASAARDILYTGRIMEAEEALGLGLIDQLCPDLTGAVQAKAAQICANSQWSVRQAKAMVRRALDGQALDDAVTRGISVASFTGPAFAKGRAAFMEKRTPDFGED